jgi:hypothetical protein
MVAGDLISYRPLLRISRQELADEFCGVTTPKAG